MTQLKRAYVTGREWQRNLPVITTQVRDNVSHDIFVSINNRVEYAVTKHIKVILDEVWYAVY